MNKDRFIHYKIDINFIQIEHSLILEQLHNCFSGLIENENIKSYLDNACKLLIAHFKNEEEFMKNIQYPYLLNHSSEHKKVASEYFKVINTFKINQKQNRFLVLSLQESLLKHIDHHDRQIETYYLNDK